MRIEVISAPAIYSELTTDLCIAHCRAYSNVAEITLFDTYRKAAFSLCEKYTGRRLNNGSYKVFLNNYENVWLPNPRATNVIVKIKKLGETALTVLADTEYYIEEGGIEPCLVFSGELPQIESKDSIVIEYDSVVDSDIKNIVLQACLDLVGMMYEVRSVSDKRHQTYIEWKLDHLRISNLAIA